MAINVSQNHAADNLGGVLEVSVGGVVEVAGPLVGRSIIDGLRRKFSAHDQVQEGDGLMDRSRDLLRMHLQLMEVREQDAIRKKFDTVRVVKNGLENFSGSRIERLREARKYRNLAKVTYRIVKRASDRGIEGQIMDQIAAAVRQNGSGNGPDTASTPRNPFTDSHAIATLTDVNVNDLDRVEMSTYEARDTGEGAVVLDLVAQDQSIQHVVATFPTEAFSGDWTDRGASQLMAPEAPVALSLHREDGTTPRLVAASPTDDFRDMSEEEDFRLAETRSLASMTTLDIYKAAEWAELP